LYVPPPMPTSSSRPSDRAFFGHPRALSTLFFTEMWERFSFYGMRAFLLPFIVASTQTGGLGFSDEKGGIVYGVYTCMVYLMTLPGGWIADRVLGQRKAVLSGGILIMTGHILLAMPAIPTFYLGLAFVCVGTGLLKPNVSTMVGHLYKEGDLRRDSAFSIFYMGINVGAFTAPLVCGYLAQIPGFRAHLVSWGLDPNLCWHFAFGAAALGMFLGIVQYLLGLKHLGDVGAHPVPAASPAEAAKTKKILAGIVGAVFGLPALVGVLHFSGAITITAGLIGDGIMWLLLGTSVVFFTGLFVIGKWTPAENRRLIVIVVLFVAALLFWTCFEQAGSTFNLFAERNTEKSIFGIPIAASYFQSVNSIFVIVLAPVFGWFWLMLARKKKEPSSPYKFSVALLLVGVGMAIMIPPARAAVGGHLASPLWLITLYFIHSCGELCLSPVGLSSMTKLAPPRIGGMVMGIWFLASAIGNYLAGRSAGFAAHYSFPKVLTALTLIMFGAAAVMFVLARPMTKMIGEGGESGPR
jgi:POT family proton-dependent oligopeptide transporter